MAVICRHREQPQAWAPAGMGNRVHLPSSENVVKCFVHCKTLSRRLIYALFSQHAASASGGCAPRPHRGSITGPLLVVPRPLICPPLEKSCGRLRPQAKNLKHSTVVHSFVGTVAVLGFTFGGSGVAIIAAGGTDIYCHSEPSLTSGKLCFIINFIGGHRGARMFIGGGPLPPPLNRPCIGKWYGLPVCCRG